MTLRKLLPAAVLAAALAATGAQAAELTFALPIANGRVPADKRLIRVKQGDVVKLQWSADKRTAIHLHGYDIEKTIEPGATTEMSFTARIAGRFTVEPHVGRTSSGGHSHGTTLVTIEVRP